MHATLLRFLRPSPFIHVKLYNIVLENQKHIENVFLSKKFKVSNLINTTWGTSFKSFISDNKIQNSFPSVAQTSQKLITQHKNKEKKSSCDFWSLWIKPYSSTVMA